MATSKVTKFNPRWLDPIDFPDFAGWLTSADKDSKSAHCKFCRKTFSLSNMGVGAIKCHAKGREHSNIAKNRSLGALSDFFKKTCATSGSSTDPSPTSVQVHQNSSSDPVLVNQNSSSSPVVVDEVLHKNKPFFTRDDTLKAEILWAMCVVEKKLSLNSCKNISKIFKKMFPDSSIAEQFQMGKDKVSYIIHYGLSHYFHRELHDTLQNCNDLTICFDESLNKVAQKGQMDLVVRFWNENKVSTRYFGSAFMGSATSQDLLDSFLKALEDVPLSKLFHISMDGPNVNLSFLKKLREYMSEENPNGKKLIDMGTCGLHVIHGAMKTGLKSVPWDIFSILRNLYYLFKDSPTRRAEFTKITGCSLFPQKFCAIRWLENSTCLARAIELTDPIKVYLKEAKLSESKVYSFLVEHFEDPLLKCKLAFFRSLSLQCESFLCKFQSEDVLVPYLHSELSQLLGGLMTKICKADKVIEGSALLKLDVSAKENLVQLKSIDIGFGAKKHLKELKIPEKLRMSFYMDCQKIVQTMCKKIIDKSPLKYKIVRGLLSLHPSMILNNPAVGITRFNIVLEVFHDANRVSESVAEKAREQYRSFCANVKEIFEDDFKFFLSGENEEKLDSFYFRLLGNEKKYEELLEIIKLSFILSHGNASVEKGFSINKTILVENLHEESLVNQRTAFDGIKSLGGAENVSISSKMLNAVRGARLRYREHLSQKKEITDNEAIKIQEKRKIENELLQLQNEKKRIRLEKEKEEAAIANKIQMLEVMKKSL